MTIRRALEISKKCHVFLCVDYKNTDKETVFWSPAYNAYSSKALSLGYRYVVSFDGRYLMSIREKYIPPINILNLDLLFNLFINPKWSNPQIIQSVSKSSKILI